MRDWVNLGTARVQILDEHRVSPVRVTGKANAFDRAEVLGKRTQLSGGGGVRHRSESYSLSPAFGLPWGMSEYRLRRPHPEISGRTLSKAR